MNALSSYAKPFAWYAKDRLGLVVLRVTVCPSEKVAVISVATFDMAAILRVNRKMSQALFFDSPVISRAILPGVAMPSLETVIRQRLRAHFEAEGHGSKSALAKALGVAPSSVTDLITGRFGIRVDTLESTDGG